MESVDTVSEAPGLLTTTEVARRLNYSPQMVRAAVRRGDLPCVRIAAPNGHLRFRPSDLVEFVERHRRSVAA